ncbi:MAG TPA: SPOR domain-containing protein [Methylophaga aminisulfidivorans]|nr:SPOR domain-containing protein [Methylophaga aminisulfidivorans]
MYVLQLASFSVQENADKLSRELKKRGYSTLIETHSSNKTTIYRVRLEPTSNRSELEKQAVSLKKELNLSPQILHYDP